MCTQRLQLRGLRVGRVVGCACQGRLLQGGEAVCVHESAQAVLSSLN